MKRQLYAIARSVLITDTWEGGLRARASDTFCILYGRLLKKCEKQHRSALFLEVQYVLYKLITR